MEYRSPTYTTREGARNIRGLNSTNKLCGTNTLPSNITTVAKELSIEFETDSITSFTGFEAEYVACFDKRQDSTNEEQFLIPIYKIEEKMRCFLDIQMITRRRALINMVINSNISGRECKDIIKVYTDGIDATNASLHNCSLNTAMTLDLTLHNVLRLIFTSENRYEFVEGIYLSEEPIEQTTTGVINELSFSQLLTTNTKIMENAEQRTTGLQDSDIRVRADDSTTQIRSDIRKGRGWCDFVNNGKHSAKYKITSQDVTSIVVPIILLLILSVVASVVAVLIKRGVISVKLPWKSERIYEDPVHYTGENQYTDPSRTLSEGNDKTAYQNEKFENGGRSHPEQNYYNVGGEKSQETNLEGTYETTEQQYETQVVQNMNENEHQYSELKI